MKAIQLIIWFSILVAFGAATVNPIREHPHSVDVTEGSWANFSCAIKLPGIIKWRIGDLNRAGHIYNSADFLPELVGVTAEKSFPPDITGRVVTETIGILASTDLDGTPVECMFEFPGHENRNSYSRYALLNVHVHVHSGSDDEIC